MPKDLSSEVGFLRDPDMPSPRSGVSDDVVESLAISNPRRVSLMMRAMRLRSAGVISAEEHSDALSDGDEGLLELTLGKSNILPAWFLDVGPVRSTAVCKIEANGTNYKGERGDWAGTGFLVSQNILLTNHHVLNSQEVARTAECIFNYQRDSDGKDMKIARFRLDPNRLFITSPTRDGLDFTFVWVKDAPGKRFGFVPFNRNFYDIEDGEVANIIHHPGGDYKSVTLQENHIVNPHESIIHYISDTEQGSSGSCVFNNQWMPVALHHAARKNTNITADIPYKYLNEGIRFSAIAAYLEALHGEKVEQRPMIEQVLAIIRGTDPIMGHFGAIGRNTRDSRTGVETVVNLYKGESDDIDIAFWNIEHFEDRYHEKLEEVAAIIARMNLDIWAFEESSREATEALADYLRDNYELDFQCEFSEPNAPADKQTTTVMWNSKTVKGKKVKWPAEIDKWLKVHSKNFDDLDLEAVEGKVFDRYPGLFRFSSNLPGGGAFDFYLVPLHLKAFDEGMKRRRMAAAIIGAAIKKMIESGADKDWIVGGDFNAPLASKDFSKLISGGMVPVSAGDEQGGAISYVKGPKSMIDHIFLSPNLADTHGVDDFFIVAHDKEIPDYVKAISDHRPVLVRLSLKNQPEPEGANEEGGGDLELPDSLRDALSGLDWDDDDDAQPSSRVERPSGRITPERRRAINLRVPVDITIDEDGVRLTGRAASSESASWPSAPSGLVEEGVDIDKDYSNRRGYDPQFLGTGNKRIPLPKLSEAMKTKAAVNQEADGADKYVLPYHHYSVVMNGQRKLAFYTAVNIDGHVNYRFDLGDREGDAWSFDPRIKKTEQIGPELYKNNPLDKGHLTRRLDPAWGDSKKLAKLANDDTFHYTNCCPQHQRFNRNKTTWGGLENYILNDALAENLRVTVFTGPVLKNNDPAYKGVKLPKQFWKVVALVTANGRLSATAYLLSQAELLEDMLEAAFAPETHQVTVRKIESMTGLDFGKLRDHDPTEDEMEAFDMKEITHFWDIKI